MNDPQQIRRALGEIRRALDSYPREGLAEILALVFKEYVVEGHQPLASGGHVIDARSDLEGLSFAELVVWLQTHLDHPELALFEVSGADVSVRVDGKLSRLVGRPAPGASGPAAAGPNASPPSAPVVSATGPARAPASTAVPAQSSSAPVPAPLPVPAAQAPAAAAAPHKEESTAETGTRFSLLEVD